MEAACKANEDELKNAEPIASDFVWGYREDVETPKDIKVSGMNHNLFKNFIVWQRFCEPARLSI